MFARLYLGIVTGMSATIFLFLNLGEGHMRRTEIETFLNDGSYFVEQYIRQHNQVNSLYQELDKQLPTILYLQFTPVRKLVGRTSRQKCELYTTLNGVPIYLSDNNLYWRYFNFQTQNLASYSVR